MTDGADLRMDPGALYREEVFTDRRAGTVRALTPVRTDGLLDTTRRVLYVGEAQLLTPAGVLPLVFEIEAKSLGPRFRGWRGLPGTAPIEPRPTRPAAGEQGASRFLRPG